MDIREQVKEVIIDKGGIAKSADFVAAGIRAVDVVNLCNADFLNRVRHGYYALAEKSAVSEERLLATLVPKGIVCVESALFHYGYSDFAPRKWSIAIPRSMSRTKLNVDVLALRPYYVQAELYVLGKTTDDFDGVTLPVYDRERTICNCFKYRSKLDNEIFNIKLYLIFKILIKNESYDIINIYYQSGAQYIGLAEFTTRIYIDTYISITGGYCFNNNFPSE